MSAFVCMGQEEVDHTTGDHAVGEPFQLVEGAVSQMQTAAVVTLIIEQLKTVGVPIHTASNLESKTITHIFQLSLFISWQTQSLG